MRQLIDLARLRPRSENRAACWGVVPLNCGIIVDDDLAPVRWQKLPWNWENW